MLAQRSFEDLGTPLSDVTFCVVDLETTGGAADDAITEVGALKVLRGEVQGTFRTLVNPARPVPAFIRLLTGISDETVAEAPPIESVLPAFLEFVGGSVFVAHNARFDTSFLNRALVRAGYARLGNAVVDTALLARKVLAGEVPNNKLETLARHLRCAHRPCHRAFEDVLATTDVLHHLIERVSGYGITTLEDLCSFSASRVDGTFQKIRLTERIPRLPGVYRFVGNGGRTLYVGKASDLRARVRSYFYGEPRRRIRDLLRETASIRVEPHATAIEAEIAEARAIHLEAPPYNRAGRPTAQWYLRIATRPVPKLSAARSSRKDRASYVGPFKSRKTVVMLIDALRDVRPIHRCGRPERCGGCAFFDLGTCAGARSPAARAAVHVAASAFAGDTRPVLDEMTRRMSTLAAQERFEEAAAVRDRAALLERCVAASAEVASLVDAGEVLIATGRRALLIRAGALAAAGDVRSGESTTELLARLRLDADALPDDATPAAHEARVLSSWLRRTTEPVRILHAPRGWAIATAAAPSTRFRVDETQPSATTERARYAAVDTSIIRSSAPAAAPSSIAAAALASPSATSSAAS